MQLKAKYADVKRLQNSAQYFPEVVDMIESRAQPRISDVAYYTPSNANWSYIIGVHKSDDGKVFMLATRFGEVVGGREL